MPLATDSDDEPAVARTTLNPRLMAVTDFERLPAAELLTRVDELCRQAAAGTVVIQLRARELAAQKQLALAEQLSRVTGRHGQLLSINDRIDVCLLVQADALHLGEASVSVKDARTLVGMRCFISVACHDPKALVEGADAVVLSPILEPRKGRPALGLQGLRQARAELGALSRPPRLFALGGIDAARAAECLAVGADGVAAIGAVFGRSEPRALLEALGICRTA
jgi:thiamine-phosphate pyrophosphorylase